MAAALSDFYPLVLPKVSGCPSIVVDEAILQAAAEFCEEAPVWRGWLDPITTVDATRTYALAVPAGLTGAKIVKVVSVTLGGVELQPTSADEMIASGYAEFDDTDITLQGYIAHSSESIALLKNPGADLALRVFVQYAPDTLVTTMPSSVVRAWKRGIASGALAQLYDMDGEPWANPGKMGLERQRFEKEYADARMDVARAFGRGRIASRPSWC